MIKKKTKPGISSFDQAHEYLLAQVPADAPKMFPGYKGLERTKYFLKLLGNPQEEIKIIHIAGTSGKGSTAFLIASLLNSFGFKVGLQLSPHLLDVRERVLINNKLINKKEFTKAFTQVRPKIEQVRNSTYGPLTYFEIWTSLAFYIFRQKKVDYAVMETGLGGLYDATNSVENPNKVVVITRLGLDHMRLLGDKLGEIAFQKAGIIHIQNRVFCAWQRSSARGVIEAAVRKNKAILTYVKKGATFKNIVPTQDFTRFDFFVKGKEYESLILKLIGLHQAENCSLALSVIQFLAQRDDFEFQWPPVKRTLQKAHLPGRMDIYKLQSKTLIIDGAHNGQKMRSLIQSLKAIYPHTKLDFLIAFKKGKNIPSMLKAITPVAEKVFITVFETVLSDVIHHSESGNTIGARLKRSKFTDFEIIEPYPQALNKAVLTKNKYLVITGSLYFIAEIYPLLRNLVKLTEKK